MQNEYTGFFQSGMQVRNKKNAIILHGTMVMIQRDAVFAINWSEDCICEDARLGLEILKSGGELKYVHNEMGQGKLPTSYQAYLDQRFRWVYGGVRILIENAASLLSLKGELSLSQKYYYIWGWLPWMAELGFIIFWLPGICIALRMLEKAEDVPSGIYLTPLMVLLGMRLVATLFVYTKNQTCSLGEIFLAVIAGVSLTYTISLAALTALWCKNFPFIRTQKSDAAYTPHFSSRVKLSIYNLNRLHLDIVIALFFVLLSISISQSHGLSDTDRIAWVICFLSLSLPGICKALMLSMEHSKKA